MNLTLEQKIDVLMKTTPVRHLLKNEATFWIAWDEQTITASGIKMGDVAWTRPVVPQPKPRISFRSFVLPWFTRYYRQRDELKDYCIIDLLGQKWQGRGYRGHAAHFDKHKEI